MASPAMHVDPGAERGPALSCMFIQVLSDGQPCHACFVYPIADRNCLAPGMSKDQKRNEVLQSAGAHFFASAVVAATFSGFL